MLAIQHSYRQEKSHTTTTSTTPQKATIAYLHKEEKVVFS